MSPETIDFETLESFVNYHQTNFGDNYNYEAVLAKNKYVQYFFFTHGLISFYNGMKQMISSSSLFEFSDSFYLYCIPNLCILVVLSDEPSI